MNIFRDSLDNAKRENDMLQEEHDRQTQRYNKTLQDLQDKDDSYRKR